MAFEHILVRFLNALNRRRRHTLPQGGDLTLGASISRHAATPFVIFPGTSRHQHFGIVGLSGSGKTYLIEHMIRQDIKNKVGFVVFDVHGDLAENIVAYLAERGSVDPDVYDRTMILEPFDQQRSFGFNPLEKSPGTSPFLQAQEFAYILRKRWRDDSLGPRTEELLRNSLYTLSANGLTLLQLPALLSQRSFRDLLVKALPSAQVKQYWTLRYGRRSIHMQAAVSEPVLTRISSFIADPQIRDIVGQQKSTFNFREAILNGRWVIINLSRGRLGDNSTILGSMIFTKLELEVMALADVPENERRLFSVYADELQNLAGDTFGRLIAEARKYKVGLVAGHQFWNQLEPQLRQAMLAVGSKAFFRLHYHDAVELAGELTAAEKNRYITLLTALEAGEAVVRIGPAPPVLITVPTHRAPNPTAEEMQTLKRSNATRYTRSRVEIQEEGQKLTADKLKAHANDPAVITTEINTHGKS